jgi:hypothetical protein
LVTAIGVTTTPVEVAFVVAAIALPAPLIARAITASLKPVEVKRECLFIWSSLGLDKRRRLSDLLVLRTDS